VVSKQIQWKKKNSAVPRVLFLVAGLATAGGSAGCGDSCPGIDYVYGPEIVFSQALEPSVAYSVSVTADGTTGTCTFVSNEPDTCSSQLQLYSVWTDKREYSARDGTAYPSGGFAGIGVIGVPRAVDVTVSIESSVVAAGSFSDILYEDTTLGDNGCGRVQFATLLLDTNSP